ncbi:pentapeptide repeat-containing protein [Delftia tsuruhatensis]|uniref:pentapeptide repeat-containing protein n=1 Tax=Delftia tsuruhatensis TaxID=180282 RepID=UPI0030D5B4A8
MAAVAKVHLLCKACEASRNSTPAAEHSKRKFITRSNQNSATEAKSMQMNSSLFIEPKPGHCLEDGIVDFFNKINDNSLIEVVSMKLKHANVSDVKFPEFNALEFMTFDVMFQGCNFESYDIGGSWIKNCVFIECNFINAGLVKANISDSEIINSNLNKSNFANAEIFNTVFKNVYFEEANLQGTVFFDCNLRGIDFKKTKLGYTRFVRCLLDEHVKCLPGVELATYPGVQ